MNRREFKSFWKMEDISDEEFEKETGFAYSDDLSDDFKDK